MHVLWECKILVNIIIHDTWHKRFYDDFRDESHGISLDESYCISWNWYENERPKNSNSGSNESTLDFIVSWKLYTNIWDLISYFNI